MVCIFSLFFPFGTDQNGCLSTCFPWLGMMSCLGYKTSRERDVGKGKSAFFSCNVVPKHIWEVGMGMHVTCKISLSNPLPFPPSHLEMCFLG